MLPVEIAEAVLGIGAGCCTDQGWFSENKTVSQPAWSISSCGPSRLGRG